jgi:hypothetical protein
MLTCCLTGSGSMIGVYKTRNETQNRFALTTGVMLWQFFFVLKELFRSHRILSDSVPS